MGSQGCLCLVGRTPKQQCEDSLPDLWGGGQSEAELNTRLLAGLGEILRFVISSPPARREGGARGQQTQLQRHLPQGDMIAVENWVPARHINKKCRLKIIKIITRTEIIIFSTLLGPKNYTCGTCRVLRRLLFLLFRCISGAFFFFAPVWSPGSSQGSFRNGIFLEAPSDPDTAQHLYHSLLETLETSNFPCRSKGTRNGIFFQAPSVFCSLEASGRQFLYLPIANVSQLFFVTGSRYAPRNTFV